MEVEDLDSETVALLRLKYHQTPEYNMCIKRIHKYIAKGFDAKVQTEREYIQKREMDYMKEYCKKFTCERLSMKELSKQMDAVDFNTLSLNCFSLVLFTDVMDTCIRNIKDVAKKYENRFQIDCYEDLYKMGTKLKMYLDVQANSRTPKVEQLYADTMDSIENYMEKRVITFQKRLAKIDEQYNRKVERERRKLQKNAKAN